MPKYLLRLAIDCGNSNIKYAARLLNLDKTNIPQFKEPFIGNYPSIIHVIPEDIKFGYTEGFISVKSTQDVVGNINTQLWVCGKAALNYTYHKKIHSKGGKLKFLPYQIFWIINLILKQSRLNFEELLVYLCVSLPSPPEKNFLQSFIQNQFIFKSLTNNYEVSPNPIIFKKIKFVCEGLGAVVELDRRNLISPDRNTFILDLGGGTVIGTSIVDKVYSDNRIIINFGVNDLFAQLSKNQIFTDALGGIPADELQIRMSIENKSFNYNITTDKILNFKNQYLKNLKLWIENLKYLLSNQNLFINTLSGADYDKFVIGGGVLLPELLNEEFFASWKATEDSHLLNVLGMLEILNKQG